MAAVAEQREKRWTYDEYYRLDDDQRYEIIDGQLLMAPAPDTWHQSWLLALATRLDAHVRSQRLGRLFISPVDVVLDLENTVQPDLVFVSAANQGIVERRGIFGVPDLVVELVSPSSVRRDRYVKQALYARFGIREFWIGDPANRGLEILTLKNREYQPHCVLGEKGKVQSLVWPGLLLDLADLE